jgi:hypothetical protein
MKRISFLTLATAIVLSACSGGGQKSETQESKNMFTGAKGEVKLMTLDPGHFHAALVQKTMLDQIDPTVYIYAPEGPELQAHLNLIESFNNRADNPTSWEPKFTPDRISSKKCWPKNPET